MFKELSISILGRWSYLRSRSKGLLSDSQSAKCVIAGYPRLHSSELYGQEQIACSCYSLWLFKVVMHSMNIKQRIYIVRPHILALVLLSARTIKASILLKFFLTQETLL